MGKRKEIPREWFEPGGVFGKRGISDTVADVEHFYPFDHERCGTHEGDWSSWPCWLDVKDVGEQPFSSLPEGTQAMIAYRIMQAPGMLFVRHGISGKPVVPEMRPEWPVLTGKVSRPHYHPDGADIERSEPWQRHVAKTVEGPDGLKGDALLEFLLRNRYGDSWQDELTTVTGTKKILSHDGEHMWERHARRRTAKYLFTAQPKESESRTHTHAEDFGSLQPKSRRQRAEVEHLYAEHTKRTLNRNEDLEAFDGVPPLPGYDVLFVAPAEHRDEWPNDKVEEILAEGTQEERRAFLDWMHTVEHSHRYTWKNDATPLARRADMHRLAKERLEAMDVLGVEGGEVWLVMESCLKSAAILSAILETERDATVMSWPSVTLMPDGEVRAFVKQHKRMRYYIVPDSDYASIQQVRTQAFVAREKIRWWIGKAADVEIAAPPAVYDANGKSVKSGADDALGKHGHTLDDFLILDRPSPTLKQYMEWKRRITHKRKGRPPETQAAIFRWLVLFADDDGVSTVSSSLLARLVWPQEWRDAVKADVKAGRDPKTGRPSEREQKRLASEIRTCLGYMKTDGMIDVVGEEAILDEDGLPLRTADGIPVLATRRRIHRDVWEWVQGKTVRVGNREGGRLTPHRVKVRKFEDPPDDAAYVGAPAYGHAGSKWQNPWRKLAKTAREESIANYRDWLFDRIELGQLDVGELRGRNLGCWCSLDEECHADLLLRLANREEVAVAA